MKILHLEDNALDAELIRRILLDEWPDCRVQVVDNRADYVAHLHAGNDAVLSDFTLVNFNGLEALELARKNIPDVPFIFLSGTIGEERALEALRAGASDYVIKDRPQRLIPAVRRALNDARLQRERRAIEEQLLRIQRLENIGALAAGIAHDFSNVLAPVLMGVPLLRARAADQGDRQILAHIESSARHGAGLVQQMLGFARGATGEPQLIQPRHLLNELMGLIGQTFPGSIRLRSDIEPDLWPLRINPTQFHQVLMSLCANARDAMPAGGTLRLHAANRRLDEASVAEIPGTRPGPYLQIEVTDTGTGVSLPVLEHMWNPYFTTKGPNHGTGLGLAAVRGIVRSHGGVISVQTCAGFGTTFQILLPASPDSDPDQGAHAGAAAVRGRGELVLIVDDDARGRDRTGTLLADHGYRVLAAADGAEALALFAPRSLEVRVVITNLEMPDLDGFTLTKIVLSLNPSVRILTVSGAADTVEIRRRASQAGRFLAKPYQAEALLGSLYKLLHGVSAPPS